MSLPKGGSISVGSAVLPTFEKFVRIPKCLGDDGQYKMEVVNIRPINAVLEENCDAVLYGWKCIQLGVCKTFLIIPVPGCCRPELGKHTGTERTGRL